MKYPHAVKGVKKLFVASLFEIISTLMVIASAVMLVVAGNDANSPLLAPAGTLALVAGIPLLVAFILQLVGLIQAKADERSFGTALWLILLALILTVVSSIFSMVATSWSVYFSSTLSAVSTAFNACVVLYVLAGIIKLADDVGENSYASRGRVLRIVLLVLFILSVGMHLISTFVNPNAEVTKIMTYVSMGASIVELVAHIWYFFYLARAGKKLSK